MKFPCPDFTLGRNLTGEQRFFFDQNGFILFRRFISPDKINIYLSEISELEKKWLAEDRHKVNGIPLRTGVDEQGNTIIQRFCFLSLFIPVLHDLVMELKSTGLNGLFPSGYIGRIAEEEKDGLVMNHYLRTEHSMYRRMGWHTDALRDIFYGQKIMPMLNIGLHLDDCLYDQGGLRFIPGTHKQGIVSQLFSKKQFIDNKPDDREKGLDIFAGDLTVHDGKLWHRVQESPFLGAKSRRRVMYISMTTGKYMPKNESSKTPFYLRLASSRLFKKSF